VLLTSVDQIDFGRMVIDFGISAHLTKPARSSALLGTVIAVIQKARALGTKAAFIRQAPEAIAPAAITMLRTQQPIRTAAVETREAPRAQPNAPLDILIAEDNEVNQLVFG